MKRVNLKKQKKKADKKLFILTFILTLLGVIAVADASAPQALSYFSDQLYFAKQQAVYALIGLFVLIIVSKIHYSFWKKIALPFFVFSLVLLVLVLIPSFSIEALGAQRWISIAGYSFQPSEIVKLSLILYLAKVADSKKQVLSYFIPLFLVASLIMFQPDFGTTLVVVSIGMVQIFVTGINLLYFSGAIVFSSVVSFFLVVFSDYRKQRLLTFVDSVRDPLGKSLGADSSYHVRQILLALGSGGFFGVGLGQSRQKYLFLPEAATDSIFAIVAEELGFLGAGILILLFFWLILLCFRVARNAPDTFSRLLAVGITTWIASQVIINIGSMVSLVPLTGLPLPLVSYGGTALVMVLASIGIMLNISKYVKKRK